MSSHEEDIITLSDELYMTSSLSDVESKASQTNTNGWHWCANTLINQGMQQQPLMLTYNETKKNQQLDRIGKTYNPMKYILPD